MTAAEAADRVEYSKQPALGDLTIIGVEPTVLSTVVCL